MIDEKKLREEAEKRTGSERNKLAWIAGVRWGYQEARFGIESLEHAFDLAKLKLDAVKAEREENFRLKAELSAKIAHLTGITFERDNALALLEEVYGTLDLYVTENECSVDGAPDAYNGNHSCHYCRAVTDLAKIRKAWVGK